MPIPDTFPHSARWDSVGLDCAYCLHCVGPASWPDGRQESRCALHDLPLAIELGPNGYKDGEWFCRDFRAGSDSRVSRAAVAHLDRVRATLDPNVLYAFDGPRRYLREHDFDQVRQPAR
jgi:hypothetical protein